MGNVRRQVIIGTDRRTDGKINEMKFIVVVGVVHVFVVIFVFVVFVLVVVYVFVIVNVVGVFVVVGRLLLLFVFSFLSC